jgi:hypothetical protein
MFLNLSFAILIATTPMADKPTPNATTAQITNASNSESSSAGSAVELAAKRHRNLFIGYVIWLIIAGLVTAAFTVAVWMTGNRQQEAINTRAQSDLEAEKTKRLGMEKSLGRRDVAMTTDENGKWNIEPLKEFTGIEAEIGFIPDDSDARRAAQALSFVLASSGWKVLSVYPDSRADRIPGDGVEISSYSHLFNKKEPDDRNTEQKFHDEYMETWCRLAANTLAAFLSSEPNNWENVRWSFDDPDATLPPNRIRIRISYRPMEYFQGLGLSPELAKTAKSGAEERQKYRREQIQSDRKQLETIRKNEELWKDWKSRGFSK